MSIFRLYPGCMRRRSQLLGCQCSKSHLKLWIKFRLLKNHPSTNIRTCCHVCFSTRKFGCHGVRVHVLIPCSWAIPTCAFFAWLYMRPKYHWTQLIVSNLPNSHSPSTVTGLYAQILPPFLSRQRCNTYYYNNTLHRIFYI
jgi:hypothetical protein